MRFKKHLNEISRPTIKDAVRLINKHLGEIGRRLEKNGWKVTDKNLVKILNAVFNRDGVRFKLNTRGVKSIGRFITSGFIWGNPNEKILIVIQPGSGDYFRRFAKPNKRQNFFEILKNEFFSQLHGTLSHELIHITQSIVSRSKSVQKTQNDDEYLSDPEEIEAFAQDAATELIRIGHSKTWNLYRFNFKPDNPTYRKFIKKMIKCREAVR